MSRKLHIQLVAVGLLVHIAGALTSGPNQPEYAGFKSAVQKDMVDLLSGDFGYTVPIMEIPGPGISYPLTLGSHSGIQNEQEASWVGLGWSLNPGAINRGLNRYPDDYYRGFQKSTFKGTEDVDAFSINAFVANFNWSENGEIHGGIGFMGLSVSGGYSPWEGYSMGGGLFGMEYGFNSRSGLGFQSTPGFMEALASFASVAAMSPTDNGAAEMSQNPVGDGQFAAAGNGFLGSVSMGINIFNVVDMVAEANYSLSGFLSRSVTVGAVTTDEHNYVVFTSSESYVDKTETRALYGYLNLGAYPKETSEAMTATCWNSLIYAQTGTALPVCSDLTGAEWSTKGHRMEFDWAQDQPEIPNLTVKSVPGGYQALALSFGRENSWAVSTQDGYTVKAEGVSFGYRPARQDLGDYYAESGVVPPHQSWGRRTGLGLLAGRHSLASRHKYDRALGEIASRFMQERTGYAETSLNGMPVTVFKQAGDPAGTFDSETWKPPVASMPTSNPAWANAPPHILEHLYLFRELMEDTDPAYSTLKRAPEFASADPDRVSGSKGIFPRYKKSYDPATGFAAGAGCTANRVPDIPECDPWVPEKALIGFTFVRPDGMIYEYHKPAFNWIYKSASAERPTNEFVEKMWGHNDFGILNSTNSLERPYAYAWLVTAVKGPDFFDLNNDGKPNEGDIGGWIRFEYGKTIRNYHWRSPYEGVTPNGTGLDQVEKGNVDGDGIAADAVMLNFKSYGSVTWGVKEIHYLTAVYSPTHQARFSLSDRIDGLEAKIREEEPDFELLPGHRQFKCPTIRPSVGDVLNIVSGANTYRIQVTAVTNTPPEGPCSEIRSTVNDACNGTGRNQIVSFTTLDASPPATFPSGSTLRLVESSRRLQRVDNVRLYENFNDNGIVDAGESLVREAKFGYSYDLAPGVPNSVNVDAGTNTGKLTLRKLELGDGNSFFPPYTFKYYMEGSEAPYHRNHWDRWGYYKRDGGLERSAIALEDIISWNNLHAEIKSGSTHWLTNIIRGNLGSRLAAIQAAASLDDDMRDELVAALTKVTRNLNLYAQNQASIGLRPSLANRPKILMDRLRSEEIAHLGVFTDDNGTLKANLTPEEMNEVEWFNNSVIEREYLWTSRTATGRSILKKTNKNRMDHEPNKDDVKAWSLKTIKLPSGGVIEAELESDDFAYEGRAKVVRVENRRVDNEPTATYFKSVGAEKTFATGTNLFEINEETFGPNFLDRVVQDADAIQVRVESVFRLYRETADASGAAQVQMNKDFDFLRNRRDAPTASPNQDEDKLHLVAWFWPGDSPEQFWGNGDFHANSCGVVPVNPAASRSMIMPVPIDLGVAQDPFEFHAAGTLPSTQPRNKFCQRNSVTFKLSALLTQNGQGGRTAGVSNCMANFLAKNYYFTWTRKRDIRASAPAGEWGMTIKTAEGTGIFTDLKTTSWAYLDPSGAVRQGNGAWAPDMHEFEAARQDQPGVFDQFENKYWDFYNFNTYVKAPRYFVGEGAGQIGGGVRTKRVVLHTGWAQKPGAPSQLQVVEYAYDGAGGFGGTYSSGSTPSIPAPFNNKGDDRRKRPESGSLIMQGPQVSYRTVAMYRPGMGRTVHHFLTSADVEDYWVFDNCNAGDGSCYGALTNFAGNRQRWRLNRVSNFQGQIGKIETFNEDGKLLSKTQMKYQVSMSQVEINDLAELSILNNSDAFGVDSALVPTVTVKDQAGHNLPGVPLNAGDKQIGLHPRSADMGKITTRYRHRYNWHFELGCQEDVIYCATNNDPHGLDDPLSTMAVSEIEEVEHSLHSYRTTQKSDGVGTEETVSFWDFLSGTPLVKTKRALGDPTKQRPVKTDVTIPAHWIAEYNPGGQSLSMGSVFRDPDFRDVALGVQPVSSLSHKNMLTQTFSTSVYSGLIPYCSDCATSDAPFWRDRLDDDTLFSRSILLWGMYGQAPWNSMRISGEKVLRMDMTAAKKLAGTSSDIKMPYPTTGTAEQYYGNLNYYPLISRNTLIDNSGKYLEVEDAYKNATSYFYKDGIYIVGQVANAHLKDARILTFDEFRSLASIPDGWTGSGTANFNSMARSGKASLELGPGSSLGNTLSDVTGGKYVLSFWTKRGSVSGSVTINGVVSPFTVVQSGKEWARVTNAFTVAAHGSIQVSIAAGSGDLVIDDVRLVPADAQVATMTYDPHGWKTSQAGPQDIITYYDYDNMGRLAEVRDHQGLLISTQAQREAAE